MNMKSKIEEAYEASLREKYSIPDGRLQIEKRSSREPIDLDQRQPNAGNSYYEQHLASLKQKYNLPDGLVTNNAKRPQERTVADFVEQREREVQKDFQIAVGSTTYQKEKVKIWFDLRKDNL